jgi:TonB-linked SusC/RagA family outer membrane protein
MSVTLNLTLNFMERQISKNRFMVFLLALIMPVALYAQQRTISGTVTDAGTGEPLIGVTVLIEGTTTGTTTDLDGNYTIRVSAGQALVFSYIGYNTETLVVGDQTEINIALQVSTEELEEVIVIGYGTTTKEDATGSVAVVNADKFNLGSIKSPQELVAGKISGVRITNSGGAPGAAATIRIRGGSSMSASNDPLIVIDGVPVDNDDISGMRNPLNTVNPGDIETFTVLKDASATAIYGSRASNGVIIITTKRGKVGKPLTVGYDGNASVGMITRNVELLNAEEFRELMNERYAENQAVLDLMGDASTDWQSEIYQPALGHDHNLSVSGATGNLPYRASIGYTGQEGIIKTNYMNRFTGNINLNPILFDDHLKVNFNLKGMNIKNRFVTMGAVGNANRMDPTQPVTSDDPAFAKYGGYFTWLDAGNYNSQAVDNPVAQLEQRKDISNVNRVIGNIQLDYKLHFLPELRLNLNLGMDYSKSEGTVDVPEDAAFGEDLSRGNGEARYYDQDKKNEVLDFYLFYGKDLGDHHLDAMAGYSWQHFYRDNSDSATNAAGTVVIDPYNSFPTENYLISFFGRFNYSFKSKYLLTFTLRNDRTSRFSPETRSGLFPSAAFAWDISDESFMSNVAAISNLKLRLGYGVTGQQQIGSGDYPYLPVYTLSYDNAAYQFGNEFVLTYRPEEYDANIKWEETVTYNIGLDYGLFMNRITGALELYYRQTNDLINTIPVPAGTNLSNYLLTNVGNLVNQGVEFDIDAKVVSRSDLLWEVGFNATYNHNELTKLTATDDPDYPGVYVGGIAGGVGNTVQIHSVGYPVRSFYVYEQVYDEEGMPIEGLYVDRNEDGMITIDDRRQYHFPDPVVFMGFSSDLLYKNFDFRFAGRISLGNWMYNNVDSERARYNNLWRPQNFLQNLPQYIYNSEFEQAQYWSDYYVRDASFLRLDNVSVGYTFNKFIHNAGRLRVFGTVQNVFVLTKYDGVDPEIENGIDNTLYPRPTTYTVGVSLNF